MNAMFFTVLTPRRADRTQLRLRKDLEGQTTAIATAAVSRHRLRLTHLRPHTEEQGVPVANIASKLTITASKNTGEHPSGVSLYRALAEAGDTTTTDDDGLPIRPKAAAYSVPATDDSRGNRSCNRPPRFRSSSGVQEAGSDLNFTP